MPIAYRIKALGLGRGQERYQLLFVISSNYDIDKDKEMLMNKVNGELRRNWGDNYIIKSVTKLIKGRIYQ